MDVSNNLSCNSCAKRKVRCDRLEPCSHCKRRKESCNYPTSITNPVPPQPTYSLVKEQYDRIKELERYVRCLGGEDYLTQQASGNGARNDESFKTSVAATTDYPAHSKATKRHHDGTPRTTNQTEQSRPQAYLVEHEKQTTYLEAPMWYTWSEAKEPNNDRSESRQGTSHALSGQNTLPAKYVATLLDRQFSGSEDTLRIEHPSPQIIRSLWDAYITNVHPIVKIFFHWDKALLITTAVEEPSSLSPEQQCLVFAIYFIAVGSLSNTEISSMFGFIDRMSLLNNFQSSIEKALTAAEYASTSNLLVLQALILYMLALRGSAKPASLSSLMGISIRIAQRLGLHRDGTLLGLSPKHAEEKRRVWWQLQHIEILLGILLGCISITLYGEWDTKLPRNIDDEDIQSAMVDLPQDAPGLTSMSYCLWRYHILHVQRERRSHEKGGIWLTTVQIGSEDKSSFVEMYRKDLSDKFLQYCEPMTPLHVMIQIGVQAFLLSLQRVSCLPNIASTRISELAMSERNRLLKICTKCMECFIFATSTPSISHFRWHSEGYMQWPAFVYILMEAHHRVTSTDARDIWTLIIRVCELHSKLSVGTYSPEIAAIGRLVILAWRQRQEHLQNSGEVFTKPGCVDVLERALNFCPPASDTDENQITSTTNELGFFDFDLIDWSLWETGRFS